MATIGTGPDAIRLLLSEDAYRGDAQFSVAVDGAPIGGVLTATASHAAGATQALDLLGSFAPGSHTVTVTFLNDVYDGPGADRNLYVDAISAGGVASPGGALYFGGPVGFQVQVPGGMAAPVTDAAGLDAAIRAADAATAGDIVITLGADITATGNLAAVNLRPGVTLTIDGQGHELNGAGSFRGLFAYAGTLTLRDLTLADTVAFGGAGGSEGAGGGAGLGGGLFVAGTNAGLGSGAAVTLQNVGFLRSGAVGGNGNGGGGVSEGSLGAYGTGGGGGGLGGMGGSYDLSGGGGGGIGGAGGTAAAGRPGLVAGAPGGTDGGGGGGATEASFASGGGGGVGAVGIAGGFGGGGGGGGGGAPGGDGGFGGGGGSGGGDGGFGGGGAAGVATGNGTGGFGAGGGATPPGIGTGYNAYSGGGGLAAGGAVFVQQGGRLTISGGATQGGTVQAGRGGSSANEAPSNRSNDGLALGTDIFLQGNQTLAFVEAAGQVTTLAGSIADQAGSGGGGAAGAGSLSLSGAGRLVLAGTGSYAGGTTIAGGTLELAAAGAAGSGAIAFTGASGVLQLDAAAIPADGSFDNLVAGLAPGRLLDLKGFDDVGGAANIVGDTLTVAGGGRQLSFALAGIDPGLRPVLAPDRAGGVLVGVQAATPNTITFNVSEDAWQGDAQYTVSVDGAQVGGVRTATAAHAGGGGEAVTLSGQFSGSGTGLHRIGIDFLNDAYGGSDATDRNLYVDSLAFDGRAAQPSGAAFYNNGAMEFLVPQAPAPTALRLLLSGDAFQGDAQYSVAIDGRTVGGGGVAAAHAAGATQAVDLAAALSAGTHDLALTFLNDAYGGPGADRNLYLDGLSVGGAPVPGAGAALYFNETQHIAFTVAQS